MHFKMKAYNFKEKKHPNSPHFPGLDGILVSLHFFNCCREFSGQKICVIHWFKKAGPGFFFFACFLNDGFMFSIIALEVTFLVQPQISECVPYCQQSRLLPNGLLRQ